jgi:hypothetical protein
MDAFSRTSVLTPSFSAIKESGVSDDFPCCSNCTGDGSGDLKGAL